MPKPLSIAKRKPTKAKHQLPESADEFLAAGVEHEEAAEKWRAGDAAKSSRFFNRAVEVYEEGLRNFPDSFDLNYNRARVQYQITQHPTLLAQYSTPLVQLLEQALRSHRRALELDSSNADVLFNTAQVLTSLAEANDHDAESSSTQLIREALAMFRKCLEIQETSLQQAQIPSEADGGVDLGSLDHPGLLRDEVEYPTMRGEPDEEQWASIVEPVTSDTILETIIGTLDAVSSLCETNEPNGFWTISELEDLAGTLIEQKVPVYAEGSDQEVGEDVTLAVAKVKGSLLEAKFSAAEIDVQTYDNMLKDAFRITQDLVARRLAALSLHAEALITFVEAVASTPHSGVLRWTRLTTVLEYLSEASNTPNDVENSIAVNMTRGDVELMRFALSRASFTAAEELPETLSNNQVRSTLLKNAETYYRGASNLLQKLGIPNHAGRLVLAKAKETVVACLVQGHNEPLKALLASGVKDTDVQEVLSSMVEDSLVEKRALHDCGIL